MSRLRHWIARQLIRLVRLVHPPADSAVSIRYGREGIRILGVHRGEIMVTTDLDPEECETLAWHLTASIDEIQTRAGVQCDE